MIEYISAFILFFATVCLVWMVVEKWQLIPDWLNYKPFSCRTCCTFWTLVAEAVGLALMEFWIAAIALGLLSCLNAAAQLIDDKNNVTFV